MFQLVDEPIDISAVRNAVRSEKNGAVLVFEGTTRCHHEGRTVTELSYEAYPEMAIAEFRNIAKQIDENWPGCKVAIVHRLGVVPVEQTSVVIAVSSPHRDAAYSASRFAIDMLKTSAPIWKKEIYADGSVWKANTPS